MGYGNVLLTIHQGLTNPRHHVSLLHKKFWCANNLLRHLEFWKRTLN